LPIGASTLIRQPVQLLLSEFTDVFTKPVAVRPYRYPQLLKDEIEKQCDDMLRQGIIRPSTSPFSAPVLLVRKKDKT
jgi:hypothetical protein